MQQGTRIYEIREGYGDNQRLLVWAAGRKGRNHDPQVSEAIEELSTLGRTSLYVVFSPTTPRQRSAEARLAQRIGNMRRRAARAPLFADQIEAEQLAGNPLLSIEHARLSVKDTAEFHEQYAQHWAAAHAQALQVILAEDLR